MKRRETDKKGGIGVWVARIVGIFDIVAGAVMILVGLVPTLFGAWAWNIFPFNLLIGGLGVLLMLVGMFYIYLGYSLFNLRNWARIVAGLLALLGLLVTVAGVLGGGGMDWFSAIVDVVIVYFLLLDKKTARAFK